MTRFVTLSTLALAALWPAVVLAQAPAAAPADGAAQAPPPAAAPVQAPPGVAVAAPAPEEAGAPPAPADRGAASTDAAPSTDAAAPPVRTGPAMANPGALGPEVMKAAHDWQQAARKKPRLVSLRAEGRAQGLEAELKGRLSMLGEKTFSNREWKSYWARQAETAEGLAAALERAGKTQTAERAGLQPIITGLRTWVALARDKMANQDTYLKAIETERDALEDRLEAAMESPAAAKTSVEVKTETLSPYAQRKTDLEDLQRRIEIQRAKRASLENDLKLVDQQLETDGILHKALLRDADLARVERSIAEQQARAPADVVWRPLWEEIAAAAREKVEKLDLEAEHGAARTRARAVEAGLVRSQIKFRVERIEELEQQLERDSGLSTLIDATWKTVLDWLTNKAWRTAFALLLVWLGLQLAIRLMKRGLDIMITRAEGDPDDTSDDDTRVLTLAAVFRGVARPALYVIAALIALDQIGVNTSPILGSVAILGLAVSFGSQNLVRDLVNGFFILIENQFAVGETVEISGKTGVVERITIRSTWIRQANGDLHVFPNGSISSVTNLTRDWARAIVHVGVSYSADLAKVEAVVNRVGQEMYAEEKWRDILDEAPCWVGVTELGDSAVVFRAWAKVDAGQQWAVSRELNLRLKLAFDAEGIEIPFPQRVVWSKPAD